MNKRILNSRVWTMTAVAAALASSLAFTACSKKDDSLIGTNNDQGAVAQTEQRAKELGNDASAAMKEGAADAKQAAREGMADAKEAGKDVAQSAKEMAADAKVAGQNASDKIGDKVADAVITTSVNAELAKDSSLSALKINVDTDAGRVALKGTAPTTAARERATTLASNVKGVVSVDNQLTVDPES
ncbi:hypothetical protein BH11PSE9_BH11PSE9_09260 [soil metagenome]